MNIIKKLLVVIFFTKTGGVTTLWARWVNRIVC